MLKHPFSVLIILGTIPKIPLHSDFTSADFENQEEIIPLAKQVMI
jgi:hypothetical protein